MKLKLSLLSAALISSSYLFFPAVADAKLPFAVDGQELPTLAPMLERVTPGVVSIQVRGSKEVRRRVDPFDFFFGAPQSRSQKRPFSGLGSGVIINADEGYVVTNNHVIDGADNIMVTLKDGREYEAKLLGADKDSDVALLQIDNDDLTEVKLANSDKLRVGDFSVAIGNPFGLSHTVTSGIVSALGRSGLNIEGYEDFIQTDAAINQGNSGGALVNLKGELIGINTAILGSSGGNVGIGFAIPSNMMKNLVDQILEYGEVRRGMLGIRGRNVDARFAKALGLEVKKGAYISEVVEESAAEKAGLKANDVIIAIDGDAIESYAQLSGKVATLGEGKKVKVTVNRDGREKVYTVTLQGVAEGTVEAINIHPNLQGAELEVTEEGITVTEVEPRSRAQRVGLREGDIIVQINRSKVGSMSEMRNLIKDIEGNIVLGIKRGRNFVFYAIQ